MIYLMFGKPGDFTDRHQGLMLAAIAALLCLVGWMDCAGGAL